MGSFVEFKNVGKTYHMGEVDIEALRDVNFIIEKGEFCVVVGASGAGKTTILNILGGMDGLSTGQVLLDGEEISSYNKKKLTAYRRYDIGFVFQFYNLVQNLTALENVELPLIYRGVAKKERMRLSRVALEKVGLKARMEHKPSEMSGGQQQRVAIARAIAQAPPVILADEPTGNLDSGSTKEIMEILKELHGEGRTVILITHDNEIAARARRIIRIMDGHIVEDKINDIEEN